VDHRAGRTFREAWIQGVKRHYPGVPKPGHIAAWEQTPEWERESAAAVHGQVRAFLEATGGQARRLSRAQKGQFVAVCWAGQILARIREPQAVVGGRVERTACLAAGDRRRHLRSDRTGGGITLGLDTPRLLPPAPRRARGLGLPAVTDRPSRVGRLKAVPAAWSLAAVAATATSAELAPVCVNHSGRVLVTPVTARGMTMLETELSSGGRLDLARSTQVS
jgi:hypothetical protein